MDAIEKVAQRLVEKVDLMLTDSMTSFSVRAEGDVYKFFRNKKKTSTFIGWYEVVSTENPEFADCVCVAANRILRENAPKNGPSNLEKLTENLKEHEEKSKPKKEILFQGVDNSPKDNVYFSPPKSSTENLFNLMYRSFLEGMHNRIRLFTTHGYLVFDSLTVEMEGDSASERLSDIRNELAALWSTHKPEKSSYTKYEIFREFGLV